MLHECMKPRWRKVGQGGGGRVGAVVASGRGRGHGRGGQYVDPLLDNPYLAFKKGAYAFHRCEKFRGMETDGHAAVDWMALEEVDEAARAQDYIEHDTPWDMYNICYCVFFVLHTKWILTTLCDRLFHMAYLPSFKVMVCEFLASFEFTPSPADQPVELDDPEESWVEVSFRLAGDWHEMSLREFVVHYSLYTFEETDSPLYIEGVHMAPV
ncbi:hypothetical protein Hanom_Chr17g01574311 [Helianthus anomalus]